MNGSLNTNNMLIATGRRIIEFKRETPALLNGGATLKETHIYLVHSPHSSLYRHFVHVFDFTIQNDMEALTEGVYSPFYVEGWLNFDNIFVIIMIIAKQALIN